ncbi:MAG: hypothetical protein ABJF88_14180 [Rhodothermales bacterium]
MLGDLLRRAPSVHVMSQGRAWELKAPPQPGGLFFVILDELAKGQPSAQVERGAGVFAEEVGHLVHEAALLAGWTMRRVIGDEAYAVAREHEGRPAALAATQPVRCALEKPPYSARPYHLIAEVPGESPRWKGIGVLELEIEPEFDRPSFRFRFEPSLHRPAAYR